LVSCGGEHGPEPLVFGAHDIGTVGALQPAHREMPAGQFLEMLDEGEVNRCPAHSSYNSDGLCGDLLRHDDAEARSDLRREANE